MAANFDLTPAQMLEIGLKRLGFSDKEIQRRSEVTNTDDFAGSFGPSPTVAADLWQRLITTTNPIAKIDPTKHFVNDFLVALHWLRKYPTGLDFKVNLKIGPKTGRKWAWFYTRKIAALKNEIIIWPDEWNTIFIITVDGVHFRIQEPMPPPDPITGEQYRYDKEYFTHKDGGAGLAYEIAISIFENRVVWVNGPFKAGMGDLEIFKSKLKDKIPKGKRVLGDRGYRGLPDIISFYNSLDVDPVREFKERALSRHENFNYRMKRYDVLSQIFRHDHEQHDVVFDAVLVICQLDLMLESPLFDV